MRSWPTHNRAADPVQNFHADAAARKAWQAYRLLDEKTKRLMVQPTHYRPTNNHQRLWDLPSVGDYTDWLGLLDTCQAELAETALRHEIAEVEELIRRQDES